MHGIVLKTNSRTRVFNPRTLDQKRNAKVYRDNGLEPGA